MKLRAGWIVCLCCLALPLIPSLGGAAIPAPFKRLTKDGRSSLDGAGMVAPMTGRIAFYRAVSENTRQLIVMDSKGRKPMLVEEAGWPDNAVWSPEGKRLAYTWKVAGATEAALKVWQYGQAEPRALFQGAPTYRLLLWSPDGRWIAAEKHRPDSKQVTLSVFSVANGTETELCPTHFNAGGAHDTFGWSPDSRQLCFPSQASEGESRALWVCNVDGTELRRLTPPECKLKAHARWSPDGKWILFQAGYQRLDSNDKYTDVWLIRPDGSEMHAVTQGSSEDWSRRYSYGVFRWVSDNCQVLVRELSPDPARKDLAPLWGYVDVQTGEVIHALGPNISSNHRESDYPYWALSADGRRFFCYWTESEYEGLGTAEEKQGKSWYVGGLYDLTSRTYRELFRFEREASGLTLVGVPALSPQADRVYLTVKQPAPNNPGQFKTDLYYIDAGNCAGPCVLP